MSWAKLEKGWIVTDLFNLKEDFITIGNLIKKSIGGENPRKIKRLINLFNIIYVLNENELDDIVIYKLLCFMLKWPDRYNQFFELYFKERKNKFKEYTKWAIPILSTADYIGYPSSKEKDYDDYSEQRPPDEMEQYDTYLKDKERTNTKIESEFKSDEIDLNKIELKAFFSTPPDLSGVKNLDQYLILLETIDKKSVAINDANILKSLINIRDIDDLIKDVIKYFDGQTIEGRYFNKNNDVILPITSTIREIPIVNIKNNDTKYEWGYKIIRYKSELSKYYFNRINFRNFEIIWIISPWKIPKSLIEFSQETSNILLSDVSMLQKLLANFK